MVEPGVFRLTQHLAYGMSRHIRQEISPGGRAKLIVDHGQLFTLLSQSQHGFAEVGATRGVHPAGTENQVPLAVRGNPLLAFQLGLSVHIERRGRIAFDPGPGAAAVKHVIRRVMHQPGTELARLFGKNARRQGVDGAGEFRLALGLVHGGVRGRIHDHVGLHPPDGLRQALRLCEVATKLDAIKVKRHQLTQ